MFTDNTKLYVKPCWCLFCIIISTHFYKFYGYCHTIDNLECIVFGSKTVGIGLYILNIYIYFMFTQFTDNTKLYIKFC